jgi:SagB-type dehydrogenase family enzyme
MNMRVKLVNGAPTEPDRLHEVFHANTKHVWSQSQENAERILRYLNTERAIRETSANHKVYRLLPQIELPLATALHMPVSDTLARRVSTRQFQPAALPLQQVSTLLQHALACNRDAESTQVPGAMLHLRSYPSGGGLYPLEVYPVLLDVAGAPRAVSHYDPVHHRLTVLRDISDLQTFSDVCLGDKGLVETASLLLLFTSIFERSTVKYGDRGYRLCLIEAGHAAQNVCLCAAAMGLGSLVYGGFHDDTAADWLGVDGLGEAVVHAVFVGGIGTATGPGTAAAAGHGSMQARP